MPVVNKYVVRPRQLPWLTMTHHRTRRRNYVKFRFSFSDSVNPRALSRLLRDSAIRGPYVQSVARTVDVNYRDRGIALPRPTTDAGILKWYCLSRWSCRYPWHRHKLPCSCDSGLFLTLPVAQHGFYASPRLRRWSIA